MDIIADLQNQLAGYYDDLIILIPKLTLALIISVIFLLFMGFFRRKLMKYINAKAEDKLLINFFDDIFKIINIIIAALLFLHVVGQSGIAKSILGAATISSIVIGFAFKDIAENFLAGVIMAFNRPFRMGDTIMTGSVEGTITEMSLRDTHLKTFDGKDVYVPNGQIIKNPLYNYTIDGFLRKSFALALDPYSDITEARNIILEAVQAVPGVLTSGKPPKTFVQDISQGAVHVQVQYWVNTFDNKFVGTEVFSQAMLESAKALKEKDIHLVGNIIELKNLDDPMNK